MLTEDSLHLFAFFDLVDMLSLECINAGVELKQMQETHSVKNEQTILIPKHQGDRGTANIPPSLRTKHHKLHRMYFYL